MEPVTNLTDLILALPINHHNNSISHADSSTTEVNMADDQLRCRYASKRCENRRSLKRNGELHTLCEMHRVKANENQRRLDTKRKVTEMDITSGSFMRTTAAKRHRQEQQKSFSSTSSASSASPSPPTSLSSHDSVYRCQYRSKRCENPRAVKQNGTLHTFCAFHRQRANETQRRVEERRRASKTAAKLKSEPLTTLASERHSRGTEGRSSTSHPDPQVLPDEDLALLQKLLFQ